MTSNNNHYSNNQNLPENNFSGIWDRDNKNEHIQTVAESLSTPKKQLGVYNNLKPKRWGFGTSLIVLVASFFVQAILLTLVMFNMETELTVEGITGSPLIILLSGITLNLTWILGMLYVAKQRSVTKSFRKEYKAYIKKWDIFIGLGIAALAFLTIQVTTHLLTQNTELNLEGADNGAMFASLDGIWLILVGLGMVTLLGPISEELFFRGMMLEGIKNSYNHLRNVVSKNKNLTETDTHEKATKTATVISLIVSSLIFGLMHFQGAETFGHFYLLAVTTLLGFIFGIVTILFKRLGPAMFAHVFYNGTTLILGVILAT